MFKYDMELEVNFFCSCGKEHCAPNMKNLRCTGCGKLYRICVVEEVHNRIWINDLLAPVEMLRVSDEIKKDITKLIKERLFIE